MDRYCGLNVGGNLSLRYVIRLALQRPWIPFHRRVVERGTEKFHDLLGDDDEILLHSWLRPDGTF